MKVIFNQALMISTAIFFGLGIQALINFLAFGVGTFTWEWYTPLSIILAGFLCALPTLALLTQGATEGRKPWLSILIHFISVWFVITLLGYLFGWYTNWGNYLGLMIMYVIIYALVWLFTWWMYMKEDKQINEKIKDFQDEE